MSSRKTHMDVLACFHRTRHVHIYHCAYRGYVGRLAEVVSEMLAKWTGGYLRRLAREERLSGSVISSSQSSWDGLIPSFLHSYLPQFIQSSSFPTLTEFLCVSINKYSSQLSKISISIFHQHETENVLILMRGTEYNVVTVKHRAQHPTLPSIQSL